MSGDELVLLSLSWLACVVAVLAQIGELIR